MFKKTSVAVLLLAVSMINLASCSRNNHSLPKSEEKTKLEAKVEDPQAKSDMVERAETKEPAVPPHPEMPSSGPVDVLPWDNSEDFKAEQQKNGTDVLMAAYRTVLKDPLPGEEENVHLAARMLCGIVLEPGKVFSQNNSIGPYSEDRGFKKGPTYIGTQVSTTIGGGVCKIASTLYNVAVLSNLQIVERHNHNMPVPYVPYGQDATVSYGSKDIKFKNTGDGNIMIWAQGIDNILYIAFYGKSKPPRVEWHHETISVQKAPVIFKNNPSLPEGTQNILIEGMDGAEIKSWVSIVSEDGSVTIKQMGYSRYKPMSTVIEKKE